MPLRAPSVRKACPGAPRSLRRGVAGVALLLATVAAAYVLPGGSILRRTAEKRNAVPGGGLRISGSIVFANEAARTAAGPLGLPPERPELSADAVLSLKVPGRCRLEASAPSGTSPLAVAQSQAKRRVEGPELDALSVAVQQVCGLLAVRTGDVGDTRAALAKHLSGLKIALGQSSLARFGGQVAYVLGDLAEGAPQLWVYKDLFQPARLRYSDAAGVAWDVRFLDYGSPATGEGFPRVVEVFRNGAPALRFTGLQSDGRGTLSDRLF